MALTKKQKEVYQFIKDYIDEHDLSPTQKEIRDHFGLKSFGSVNKYLQYLVDAELIELDWNARRSIRVSNSKLENITNSKPLTGSSNNAQTSHNSDYSEIPLLGDVAAGNPILALEDYSNTTHVPSSMIRNPGKYFALNICGDSMIEDGIFDGDVIVCRHQQNANQGQTVVAVIEGEATVKRYYKKANAIELHPANERLKPFSIGPDKEFKIAGIVVGLIRSYE